jgi:hypothetical protein
VINIEHDPVGNFPDLKKVNSAAGKKCTSSLNNMRPLNDKYSRFPKFRRDAQSKFEKIKMRLENLSPNSKLLLNQALFFHGLFVDSYNYKLLVGNIVSMLTSIAERRGVIFESLVICSTDCLKRYT